MKKNRKIEKIGHPHIILDLSGHIWIWRSFSRSKSPPKNREQPINSFWSFWQNYMLQRVQIFEQDFFSLGSTTLFS